MALGLASSALSVTRRPLSRSELPTALISPMPSTTGAMPDMIPARAPQKYIGTCGPGTFVTMVCAPTERPARLTVRTSARCIEPVRPPAVLARDR